MISRKLSLRLIFHFRSLVLICCYFYLIFPKSSYFFQLLKKIELASSLSVSSVINFLFSTFHTKGMVVHFYCLPEIFFLPSGSQAATLALMSVCTHPFRIDIYKNDILFTKVSWMNYNGSNFLLFFMVLHILVLPLKVWLPLKISNLSTGNILAY